MRIERFLEGLEEKMRDPDDVDYMSVIVPGDLDPFDRLYRFSIHVDAELRLAGLGCSVGGGTMFSEEDEDGESEILFCVLDVDATDVDGARALLRLHLPELGCPEDTMIQYGEDLEDRYDGEDWLLAQPRTITDD
ncbi:hypothetical protein U1769_06445 [Sphingomonas sp. ZT3P38]|uniref:hypothetical protein n=1 Tax=Parasphingomonas zepuensis TaxID=3096161 RepID=UPI002FC8E893